MSEYISRKAILGYLNDIWLTATPTDSTPAEDKQFAVCRCMGLQDAMDAVKEFPAADVVEVVRCRECKHRIVNEHYGEKGYMKLEAMCELDTGDPFELGRNAEDDDWYCADGERRDGGPDA